MSSTPVDGTIKKRLRPLTIAELLPEFGEDIKISQSRKNAGKSLAQTESYQTSSQLGDNLHRSAPRLQPVRVVDIPGFDDFFNSPKTTKRKTSFWTQKKWNSSAKLETKNIHITGNAASTRQKLQNSKIRKALNFISKPEPEPVQSKIPFKPKSKVVTPKQKRKSIRDERSTPIFAKPVAKAMGRKSIFYRPAKAASSPKVNKEVDKNTNNKLINSRMSGVFELEQTPNIPKSEKINAAVNYSEIKMPTENENSKVVQDSQRTHLSPLTESADSSIDSSDTSFLQLEKESCQTILNHPESVSTPFKTYRPVNEFFDISNNAEISFSTRDVPQQNMEVGSFCQMPHNKDETMIAKLCDMMSKADFRCSCDEENCIKKVKELTEMMKQELEKKRCLLQRQQQLLILDLKSNEKAITTVNNFLLTYNDRLNNDCHSTNNNTSVQQPKEKCETTSLVSKLPKSQSAMVRKQRTVSLGQRDGTSPSFAVPRKTTCLRKRTLHKSLPINVNRTAAQAADTTSKNIPQNENLAVSTYMQMKKSWTFLKTPKKAVKRDGVKTLNDITNTPSSMATSINLQMQLDKLYNSDSE